jgi:hypothetical protein
VIRHASNSARTTSAQYPCRWWIADIALVRAIEIIIGLWDRLEPIPAGEVFLGLFDMKLTDELPKLDRLLISQVRQCEPEIMPLTIIRIGIDGVRDVREFLEHDLFPRSVDCLGIGLGQRVIKQRLDVRDRRPNQ